MSIMSILAIALDGGAILCGSVIRRVDRCGYRNGCEASSQEGVDTHGN